MRLLLTCVLAALAVMTSAMVLPQDGTFESGLQSSFIRRSPGEQSPSSNGVEEKCYIDQCPPDRSSHFSKVWSYDSTQSFSQSQGVYPDFAGQFSSFGGWDQVTIAIAGLTNSINAYAAYLQTTQLSVTVITVSVRNFISSFYVIASQCYQRYSSWGDISSWSDRLGPIYAQLWEAIQGLLMYCEQSFGINTVISRQSDYWNKLNTGASYFVQFGQRTQLSSYFKSYPVDFTLLQSKFGISSVSTFTSYSSSSVRQTPWVQLTQSSGKKGFMRE